MPEHINKSCIIFDAPYYLPGETVAGLVLLILPKTIDARYLKLTWEGKTFVGWYKSPDTPVTNMYHDDYCYLWMSEDGKDEMPAGSYTFPFSFELPDKLPPSFVGHYGNIMHGVRLDLSRPKSFNERVYKEFIVTKKKTVDGGKPISYNRDQMIYRMFMEQGVIETDIDLKSKILTPGQYADVKIVLKNCGIENPIKTFTIRFNQRTHYHSRPQLAYCKRASSAFCPLAQNRQKNVLETVAEQKLEVDVTKGFQESLTVPFLIPRELTPTFYSPSITIEYELQVVVKPEGWFMRPAEFGVHVIVGGHKKAKKQDGEAGGVKSEESEATDLLHFTDDSKASSEDPKTGAGDLLGYITSCVAPPPYSP